MITDFNLESCRESAIIYSSVLEQIEMLYEDDRELAGELAIAAIQTVLSGETTTDNKMIQVMLAMLTQSAHKNAEKYEKKMASKRASKIRELQLDDIAELASEGLSTREIGEQLNTPKSTIAYRLGVIKEDYPELLSQEVSNCPTCPTYDSDSDSDSVSVSVSESVSGSVSGSGSVNDSESYNVGDLSLSDKPKAGLATQALPRGFGNFVY